MSLQAHDEQSGPGKIRTILGTMSIPKPLDLEQTQVALDLFTQAGHNEIDTAIMYQGGETEKALGELGICRTSDTLPGAKAFTVAIKANPWYSGGTTGFDAGGGLRADLLEEQVRKSLQSLRTNKADLFYLHFPDHVTPLDETLQTVARLKQEGLFEEWGLSNYPAWQVVDIWHTCRAHGWQPPVVYQGMYNAITRDVERELFPALRYCNMRFYAYNPLAGGMLTGKHTYDKDDTPGRFDSSTQWGAKYRERYWHQSIFNSIEHLKALCEQHGTDLVSASLRWLYHHSKLDAKHGDGVILGGSTIAQAQMNVAASVDDTALPDEIVQAFQESWQAAKPVCASYFR